MSGSLPPFCKYCQSLLPEPQAMLTYCSKRCELLAALEKNEKLEKKIEELDKSETALAEKVVELEAQVKMYKDNLEFQMDMLNRMEKLI